MKLGPSTVAVVTGAASGIGRALALELAHRGATLALADVNEAGLQETVGMVAGVKVSSHVVDVSDPAQMQTFADAVQARHGKVTLLVNNAGVALGGSFDQISLDDMRWLMGINFWGIVYGCKFFLPLLRHEQQAHIVNLSSVFGLFAPPGQTAYAAAKFAVRGFSESLRHELEGSSVGLSVVHPGGIKTNIARNARSGAGMQVLGPEAKAELEKSIAGFERAFITSAEAAAKRILRGVERNQGRILVGPDAAQADLLQRLLPATYWRVIGRLAPK